MLRRRVCDEHASEASGSELNLEQILWIDFSVLTEIKRERSGENVDEKVKDLVFVDFTVCLLWVFRHNSASRLLNYRLCDVLTFLLNISILLLFLQIFYIRM